MDALFLVPYIVVPPEPPCGRRDAECMQQELDAQREAEEMAKEV